VLSGFWSNGQNRAADFGGIPEAQSGKVIYTPLTNAALVNVTEAEQAKRELADTGSRPQYKNAADAQRSLDNFMHLIPRDPASSCNPPGVARLGAPTEIVQTPQAVYLLYQPMLRANTVRVVPTDGRKHDPDFDPLPNGDSVGRWEGDTLVIDTVSIDPDTWADNQGSIHSKDFHVVERLTRKGSALIYQLHLEDPIFARPFDARTLTLLLGKASEHLTENYPCTEKSAEHMVESVPRTDPGLPPDLAKDPSKISKELMAPPPPGATPPKPRPAPPAAQ
jgi:hypothetical protein